MAKSSKPTKRDLKKGATIQEELQILMKKPDYKKDPRFAELKAQMKPINNKIGAQHADALKGIDNSPAEGATPESISEMFARMQQRPDSIPGFKEEENAD